MNTSTAGVTMHIETDENFSDRWWVLAIRGLLACLFGLVAFFLPGVTMLSLVFVFGAYSLVDGALWIYAAVKNARSGQRSGLTLLNGLLGVVVGLLALAWPAITVAAFVLIVAAWALVTGWLMLIAAIRSRRRAPGRGWRFFGAIVSILFALSLIVAPFAGALVLTWWLGAWAVVFGSAMVFLALRLRNAR